MGKENIGHYKRTPAMRRKAAKATKRYWANRKRSEAHKKLVEERKAAGIKVHTNGRPYSNLTREEYSKKYYLDQKAKSLMTMKPVAFGEALMGLREKTFNTLLLAHPEVRERATSLPFIEPKSHSVTLVEQRPGRPKQNRWLKNEPESMVPAFQCGCSDHEGADVLSTLAKMQQDAAEGKDTRFSGPKSKNYLFLDRLFRVRDQIQTALKVVDQTILEVTKH